MDNQNVSGTPRLSELYASSLEEIVSGLTNTITIYLNSSTVEQISVIVNSYRKNDPFMVSGITKINSEWMVEMPGMKETCMMSVSKMSIRFKLDFLKVIEEVYYGDKEA